MPEKSSDHRLAGAVEKFNRSKEQFDELRSEMEAFFGQEPKPHSSRGEFDTKAWEWVERFQIRGNITLGIAFGEIGLDAADFKVIAKYVKTILQALMADFPETEFVDG